MDSSGRAVSISGPAGRNALFQYSAAGQLIIAADPRGKSTTYAYDTAGRLNVLTTAEGEITTTSYDINGRMVEQIDPRGGKTTFRYSGNLGRDITRVTNPAGVLTDYIYQGGRLLSYFLNPQSKTPEQTDFSYDLVGNIVKKRDPSGALTLTSYDQFGNVATSTDALGRTTSTSYNEFNQPVSITNAVGTTTILDYDARGNLIELREPQSSTVVAITHFDRDPLHPQNILKITDPDGRVTQRSYTSEGFLASEVAADGGMTSRSYSPYGEVLTETSPRGNALGATSAVTARYTSNLTYNTGGALTSLKDPLGRLTTINYDGVGRPQGTTDPAGKSSSTTYWPGGLVKTQTDAAGRVSSREWDPSGQPAKLTQPDGGIWTWEYNAQGRLAKVTRPSGNEFLPNKEFHSANFTYNKNGQLFRVTALSPQGGTAYPYIYWYDILGRIREQSTPDRKSHKITYDAIGRPASVTSGDSDTTLFKYDLAGHRTSVTDPMGNTKKSAYSSAGMLTSTSDPLGNITRYQRDSAGRLAGITTPRGTCTGCSAADFTSKISYDSDGNTSSTKDALGSTTRFTTDPVGNITEVIDANNHKKITGYDVLDRITTVRAPDGGLSKYSYDPVGNPLTATSPRGGVTSYTYDSLDRPLTITDPLGRKQQRFYTIDGQVSRTINARKGTTDNEYDSFGRLTSRKYSNANTKSVYFTYYPNEAFPYPYRVTDGLGTQSWGWSDTSRLRAISRTSSTPGVTTGDWGYTYNADGTVQEVQRPDGTSHKWTYDAAAQPVSQSVRGAAGTFDTDYSWDPDGQLLSSSSSGMKEWQSWDRAGRLSGTGIAELTGASKVSQRITRDPVGNPVGVSVERGTNTESKTYSFDANDRLQGVCYRVVPSTGCAQSDASQWWAYDLSGNRVSERTSSPTASTLSSSFDLSDRLTGTSLNGGPVSAVTSDPDGNVLSASGTSWTYDANNRELSELSKTGVTTLFARDDQGNVLT